MNYQCCGNFNKDSTPDLNCDECANPETRRNIEAFQSLSNVEETETVSNLILSPILTLAINSNSSIHTLGWTC